MSRQALHKRSIRKLSRTGRNKSVAVTLPIEYIRDLKWQAKQKVIVEKRGKILIIRDWQK